MAENVPELTEAEVVRVIHEHIQGLFPRNCPNCRRHFATYREYLENTAPQGFPVSYDVEIADWKPEQSAGNLSLANCRCGTTLSLSSDGMPLTRLWQVLKWVQMETARRGVDPRVVLTHLRAEVRKQGLA